MKKLFWVSWWSGGYEDEGCIPETPFQYWWSGQRSRANEGMSDEQHITYMAIEDDGEMDDYFDKHSRSDGSACALLSADSPDEIWKAVAKHFPDYEERFCDETDEAAVSDRFGGFENRTSLT